MVSTTIGSTRLSLILGVITQQDADAIVNAANSSLLGGGGVDGAIHRAGGPEILEECKVIREKSGECWAGQAVITGGGRLIARFVIHAVGPIWRGGKHNEDGLLRSAYRNSLRLAAQNNVRTIAFPSLSTGAYGFPIKRASRIAFETVKDFVKQHPRFDEVRFIVFSRRDFDVYAGSFAQDPSETGVAEVS